MFASIKLPQHDVPENNYRLNDTIIFLLCCVKKVLLPILSKWRRMIGQEKKVVVAPHN